VLRNHRVLNPKKDEVNQGQSKGANDPLEPYHWTTPLARNGISVTIKAGGSWARGGEVKESSRLGSGGKGGRRGVQEGSAGWP